MRWNETSNPSAGTTCVISHVAAARTRHVITALIASQQNLGAAAYTSTLTIRDASIAGTILAELGFISGAAAAERQALAIEVRGLKGNALVAHFAPPAASVTQKITAAGYSEEEAY